MRALLTLLLLFHGVLHFLGFLKLWRLAALPQLSGRTLVPLSEGGARFVGVTWLAAALAFVAAAILLFRKSEAWWQVALPGLVVSQALIILQWQDAKAGTLANALLALAVLVAASTSRFKDGVTDDVRALLASGARANPGVVRPSDLEGLPQPVRRWLLRSGVMGKPRVLTVRLKQTGEMRTAPGQAVMPARAEQYFSVEPPAFIWSVDVTMFGVLPVVGCDRYVAGKGGMTIKAASLVNVVEANGNEIDQGTLLRYLGEIVWFPSAALSPHIAWEAIDASHAKATMSYRGVTASGIFAFDDQGRFASLSAQRFMGSGKDARLERWFVPASEWKRMHGIELPVRGAVVWKLADGDFEYYRWEITDVEYDATVPYPHEALADARADELARASIVRRSLLRD